jgi:hypothetical protein
MAPSIRRCTRRIEVDVLGDIRRKRRRHVQHKVAAGDSLRPARVVFEIGGDEVQTIAWLGAAFLQHGAHAALALQTSDRGAHPMARGQELHDGMAADEARPAGHQNCADRGLSR